MTDLTTDKLRALAGEWRKLDLQASMTEAEQARYEKLPLLMAEALDLLAAEVLALRAERERLRGVVEHARGALIGLAQMECDDRDENESDNDDAWSDGYDNAVDKVETRAWAAVEWIDAALSGEPQP